MIWKDVSSYSRDEKNREIKSAECSIGDFRLVVTRHIYYPGCWVASCHGVFDLIPLDGVTLEAAKRNAVEIFVSYLQNALDQCKEA